MIESALRYLSNLTQSATVPTKIESGNVREIRYALNGGTIVVPIEPKPRDHEAGSLDDLIAFANGHEDGVVVVWYEESEVTAVLDDDGHRFSTITLPLDSSGPFATLLNMAGIGAAAWHEQKPFVRLLRVDLAGTLAPYDLLEKVRKVRFENGAVTSGQITKSRESIGRTITAEVQSEEGEIPEEVTLMVPLYSTQGETERYGVRCSVEVDPGIGKFRLLPLPDELSRVQHLAMASIKERLTVGLTEGIATYYGKP